MVRTGILFPGCRVVDATTAANGAVIAKQETSQRLMQRVMVSVV